MNKIKPPVSTELQNKQLDLFQTFLFNTDDQLSQLSNTLAFWDSIPRYSITARAMTKLRKAGEFPQLVSIPFNFRGKEFTATIQPAWLHITDTDGKDVITGYYPSANEELVEDALRKLAAQQNNGYFDKPGFRSGVVFSLHALRKELESRGHTRNYYQIIQSLHILAGSTIKLHSSNNTDGEGFSISAYLTGLSAVSRSKLEDDPSAKWIAQFHPLVTHAIDSLTYRQYNYAQMMGHATQLARWLHKQLSIKFTFASMTTSFEMRFSTIKRDSALLEGYQLQRKAISMTDDAWEELKSNGVISSYTKNEIIGLRKKLVDVVYTVVASREFITEMKASNKRQQNLEENNKDAVVSTSGSRNKKTASIS
jgi:hypothetical protein